LEHRFMVEAREGEHGAEVLHFLAGTRNAVKDCGDSSGDSDAEQGSGATAGVDRLDCAGDVLPEANHFGDGS
jgi:hypothetical protein